MQTKIKVKTADLLVAVKARRAETVAKHKDAVAAFDKAKDGRSGAIVATLEKALRDAKAGRFPTVDSHYRRGDYHTCLIVPVKLAETTKPALNTGQIDRLIQTLEMASDETIAISADDAAQYLG